MKNILITSKSILQVAIEHYNRKILLLLLGHGADPNFMFSSSPLATACGLFFARNDSCFEILSILRNYGATSDELAVRLFCNNHTKEIEGKESGKKIHFS